MEYLGHPFLRIEVNISKSFNKHYISYPIKIFEYWPKSQRSHELRHYFGIGNVFIDLLNIHYRSREIIYTTIKILKNKGSTNSKRLGKYSNVATKPKWFLYLYNESNPSKNQYTKE